MIEKLKSFFRWLNFDVHLGKLWAVTLLAVAFFIAMLQVFGNSSRDSTTSIVLALVMDSLLIPAVIVTFKRVSRWYDASPRFQNWLTGLVLTGLLAWLILSVIIHPTETLEFFSDSFNKTLADPFIGWFYKIAGWLVVGTLCFTFIISIVSFFVRRLRNRHSH